ncbi:hypothetical protein F4553_007735 [Allocatelliglobosispora scoriae]|uniref:Alpha/beta hydrolase n=1 Tax=Allocatelliglobosispora scoriae TaxID=643052 RepID=A0A841C683_9ACTN|nr:hypothetical protein [Allocatelliglobosispora scoriae]MBB5874301.1 hypothetical protein [Allocatelliglobosispora scoriae]
MTLADTVWVPPLAGTRERLGYLAGMDSTTHFADIDAAQVDLADPYAALSGVVLAIARKHGARRAAAMCRGASTLLRAVLDAPDQFDAVVLIVPFAFDQPRLDGTEFVAGLTEAAAQQQVGTIEQMLLSTLAEPGRSTVAARAWALTCAQRYILPETQAVFRWLCAGVPTAGIDLATPAPQTRVLVVGQPGDIVHPLPVAQAIADYFPQSMLLMCDDSADIFARRREIDAVVTEFLAG